MSPRPRETSDAEILAATARVMQRLSPVQLTLAEVAREAGVVPATLIQRFGTKRGLLLAVVKTAPDQVAMEFATALKRFRSPLAALIEVLVGCTGFANTPEEMANGLAYLQIDLTDAEFHAVTLAQFKQVRGEIRKLLDDAVAADELSGCDTLELARVVQGGYNGSMLIWAIYRKGSLAGHVRADVKALLRPYIPTRRRARFG
jgi:AcrR family transcriptional regulator